MQAWFSRFIRGRTFAILFYMLGAGLILYLTSRLGILAESWFGYSLRPAILLLLSAICLYMLIYVNTKKDDKKPQKLFHLCGILFCFFPSMIACFLLFDLLRGIFGIEDGRLYLIPFLIAVGISLYGFGHARKLTVREYTVPILPDSDPHQPDLTAVLLSDIHAGSYVTRHQLHKIVETVNGLHPDLVILAGDTFDQDAFGHCDMDGIRTELQHLTPKGRIYAVLGNHDPKSTHPEVRDYFRSAGIRLLIDQWADTDHLRIAGRDDILGNPGRKPLNTILPADAPGKPLIVIDHNPLGIDEAVRSGASLILCGHTHKGQFFPATLFTKWAYGRRGFYGHCQTGGCHSIVSSGAGYFQLPVRIGTDSEVVAIHLVKS